MILGGQLIKPGPSLNETASNPSRSLPCVIWSESSWAPNVQSGAGPEAKLGQKAAHKPHLQSMRQVKNDYSEAI